MAEKIAYVLCTAAFAFASCGAPLRETRAADSLEQAVVLDDKVADEDLVCRTEKPTGSNVAKRVCRTRALIEQERADAEKFVERMRVPRPSRR